MAAERFTFLAPAHLVEAFDAAAARKCTTSSEYVRQAVLRQLEFDGVDLSTGQHVAPGITPWLDQREGEDREFALVDGDAVLSTCVGFPEGDKRTWLPLLNADAQPLDMRTQYREKPYLKRDGDRVLRIYPIRNRADSFHAADL